MIFAYIIKGIAELVTVYLLLQAAFDVFRPEKKSCIGVSLLFLLFIVSQGLVEYPVRMEVFLHIAALLMVALAYRTKLVNQMIAAAFTFFISAGSQVIVFFLTDYIDCCPIQVKRPAPHVLFWLVLGASIVEVLITLGMSKLIRLYRTYPQRIYASIFLIAFCLCTLAIEMIITLADENYLPTTLVTLILVLFCVGLCIGLFQEQLQVQEERHRLEFLEKHHANQVAHYAAFYNYHRDVHKMRHDMKNFIIGAQSYLQQHEYERLGQYLSQFLGSIQPAEFIDTGNPLLDAVMSAKRADAPQIPFEVSIPPLVDTRIDPMDIAMLLATALDNAIEGCEGYEQPYIRIKIAQQGRTLFVLVQNPTNRSVREKNHRLITQKENANQHGYGIPGMQRIAGKYHGHLSWSLRDEVFSLRVLLQDLVDDRQ